MSDFVFKLRFLPGWYRWWSGAAPCVAACRTRPEQTSHLPGRSVVRTWWWELLDTQKTHKRLKTGAQTVRRLIKKAASATSHLVYTCSHWARRSPGSSPPGHRSLRWPGSRSDWQTPCWGGWSGTPGSPSRSRPPHIRHTETFETGVDGG